MQGCIEYMCGICVFRVHGHIIASSSELTLSCRCYWECGLSQLAQAYDTEL